MIFTSEPGLFLRYFLNFFTFPARLSYKMVFLEEKKLQVEASTFRFTAFVGGLCTMHLGSGLAHWLGYRPIRGQILTH